jgi:hypothetical protein
MPGVPTDPYSAGIMAAGSIASAAMQPGGPSSAGGNQYNNQADFSAWSVAIGTGQGAVSGAATNARTDSPTSAGIGKLLGNPLVLVGAALVLYLVLRK